MVQEHFSGLWRNPDFLKLWVGEHSRCVQSPVLLV